jgi:addiction module RelE/StbE family toxin
MVKIIWSNLALADLRSIHDFIANDSAYYAENQIDKIIERIGQLERFPSLGRVVPEFNSQSLRELIEGHYRIVYSLKDEQVEIARIHHSAKQFE